MPHSIKPESPLDPITAEILGLVQKGAADAGIACMVVGATARDILLTHVYGLAPARMTYDVDFAVAVGNWEQFEQMKSLLLARKCFDSDDRMKQRLYFVGQDKQRSHPLDLVPFGEIAQDGNQIAWPPDLKVIMNVAGYEEVLNSAEEVQVTPGLIVKVASLAGLAILKLIAWSDRGRSNPKDVQDLFHIMTNYAEAGNNDRLYDEELMILESASFDPELAGSRLLGKDVAHIASEPTYQRLRTLLDQEHERIALDMVRAVRHVEGAQEKVELRLNEFKMGMLMR